MKHSFVDEYSGLDSFMHRLDPRTKLTGSLLFILAVVLTPASTWKAYAVYMAALIGLFILSRLPLKHVLRRSLVVFPFAIMIAIFVPFFKEGQAAASIDIGVWHVVITYEGLAILLNVMVKSWLCILCLIILSSTTRFADLLLGLQWLRVPHVFIEITSFMYRYMFVIADQAMRMQMARDSRNFGGTRNNIFKTMGNMIGTLFIHSYERAERIYAAMLSRGYNGQEMVTRPLKFSAPDAAFALMLLVFLAFPAVLWW